MEIEKSLIKNKDKLQIAELKGGPLPSQMINPRGTGHSSVFTSCSKHMVSKTQRSSGSVGFHAIIN